MAAETVQILRVMTWNALHRCVHTQIGSLERPKDADDDVAMDRIFQRKAVREFCIVKVVTGQRCILH